MTSIPMGSGLKQGHMVDGFFLIECAVEDNGSRTCFESLRSSPLLNKYIL